MQVALTVILRKTVLLAPEMAKPWKAKEKSWKSQKKLIPFKVLINHPVTFFAVAVLNYESF